MSENAIGIVPMPWQPASNTYTAEHYSSSAVGVEPFVAKCEHLSIELSDPPLLQRPEAAPGPLPKADGMSREDNVMSLEPLKSLSKRSSRKCSHPKLLLQVREKVCQNYDRYTKGDFLDLSEDNGWSIELGLKVDLNQLKGLDPEGGAESEVKNSMLVWRTFGGLSPALDTEERIWAWLRGSSKDAIIAVRSRHFFGGTWTGCARRSRGRPAAVECLRRIPGHAGGHRARAQDLAEQGGQSQQPRRTLGNKQQTDARCRYNSDYDFRSSAYRNRGWIQGVHENREQAWRRRIV
jgi:hypothetical protein